MSQYPEISLIISFFAETLNSSQRTMHIPYNLLLTLFYLRKNNLSFCINNLFFLRVKTSFMYSVKTLYYIAYVIHVTHVHIEHYTNWLLIGIRKQKETYILPWDFFIDNNMSHSKRNDYHSSPTVPTTLFFTILSYCIVHLYCSIVP